MYKEGKMALCGDDHQKLIARINRIEGQIRGLRKMVEENQDCLDVLKQIAAAGGALRSLGALILEDHLKGCVVNAIRNQDHESELITEVIDIFNKFSK
jgi:DNA-binding FrmR family transcriptional regulator